MSKPVLKWRCDACGEAENCDIHCVIEIWASEPTVCPVSGDEADWYQVKEPTAKPTRRSSKAFSAADYKLGDKSCTEE